MNNDKIGKRIRAFLKEQWASEEDMIKLGQIVREYLDSNPCCINTEVLRDAEIGLLGLGMLAIGFRLEDVE